MLEWTVPWNDEKTRLLLVFNDIHSYQENQMKRNTIMELEKNIEHSYNEEERIGKTINLIAESFDSFA